MTEGKYKRLAYNSIIFSVANFGSKILHFLIVPFYTYCLTTTEYGTVDTITTTVSLLLPILLMAIHEATLRFSLKNEVDKRSVLSNSFFVLILTSLLFLASYFIFDKIALFSGLWGLFYTLLVFQSINSILLNYTRGIGKSVEFAIGGIINTLVLLASNVLFLAVLKRGVNGYLISMIFGYAASNVYLAVSDKVWRLLSVKAIDLTLAKDMVKYSFPLMPVTIMWWVMNVSDRYVINWLLGVSYTGIYAVSSKIPSIITTVYQIFQQAWQLSAIEEKGRSGEKEFYNNVYTFFTAVLVLVSSLVILCIKPIISMLVSTSYVDAWKYSPFLIVGAIFSSMAGLLGVNYAVVEKTKGALITTVISACVNLVANVILTPICGMQGTAFATLIGFYVLWILRARDTKKYMNIEQDYVKIHIVAALLLVQCFVLINEVSFYYLIQAIIFLILFLLNKSVFTQILKMLQSIIDRKRRKKS